MQGGSADALIFSWACWSGIWPRLDARLRLRRLAGPNWPQKVTFLKNGFPSPEMVPRGPGAPNNLISGGLRPPDIYIIYYWVPIGSKTAWHPKVSQSGPPPHFSKNVPSPFSAT